MIKTQKIVIVGGGSAGWMTAAALIKSFPERDITVVCSSDDPIIGVGESTIGGIKVFTNYIGIDEKDFLKETNASYKLSICFTDFYKKDSGSFHYPFGTINILLILMVNLIILILFLKQHIILMLLNLVQF